MFMLCLNVYFAVSAASLQDFTVLSLFCFCLKEENMEALFSQYDFAPF